MVEYPELSWNARINFLRAKDGIKQKELYIADLLWAIARKGLEGDIPMPSEVWNNRDKIDRRSADQIIDDMVKKYGGE